MFSTVTRLLTLTESIAEVPNQQVAKLANCLLLVSSFFSEDSTTMTEAITMIQMRRSATGSGLLHPHHSVLKQIKPFSSDSQSARVKYLPLCAVLFCSVLRIKRWLRLHRKHSLEHELFCLGTYNTGSTLYDGPKVSYCRYVIIVRTLIQLLDHYRPY